MQKHAQTFHTDFVFLVGEILAPLRGCWTSFFLTVYFGQVVEFGNGNGSRTLPSCDRLRLLFVPSSDVVFILVVFLAQTRQFSTFEHVLSDSTREWCLNWHCLVATNHGHAHIWARDGVYQRCGSGALDLPFPPILQQSAINGH